MQFGTPNLYSVTGCFANFFAQIVDKKPLHRWYVKQNRKHSYDYNRYACYSQDNPEYFLFPACFLHTHSSLHAMKYVNNQKQDQSVCFIHYYSSFLAVECSI